MTSATPPTTKSPKGEQNKKRALFAQSATSFQSEIAQTWFDIADVPSEDQVDGAVNQHHVAHPGKVHRVAEFIAHVVPLQARRLFLKASDEHGAKTECCGGRQGLQQQNTTFLPLWVSYHNIWT